MMSCVMKVDLPSNFQTWFSVENLQFPMGFNSLKPPDPMEPRNPVIPTTYGSQQVEEGGGFLIAV